MKFIGMIFVFISCAWCGLALGVRKKDEMLYTESLISLISFIKSNIYYFKTELGEIYSEYSNDFLDKTGFTGIMKRSGFGEAVRATYIKYGVPDTELRILTDFADKLGKTDGGGQMVNCDYALESMRAYYLLQKEKYPVQRKIYLSLGVLAGALLVIILI